MFSQDFLHFLHQQQSGRIPTLLCGKLGHFKVFKSFFEITFLHSDQSGVGSV